MKKSMHFKFAQRTVSSLKTLSKIKGMDKTAIVERAIALYYAGQMIDIGYNPPKNSVYTQRRAVLEAKNV